MPAEVNSGSDRFGEARRDARPLASMSTVSTISATQTSANPIQRSSGISSCSSTTPTMNCIIGARYWVSPM